MSTAAVANSNYQKTNNMAKCAGRFISLLGHVTYKPSSLSVLCFCTFCTHRGVEGAGTVQQEMPEALRCSQGVPRQHSDPQALTSSPPGSSGLIGTADQGSFASIFPPAPLSGTFAHPTHPEHSLNDKLISFSDFGPPKYV